MRAQSSYSLGLAAFLASALCCRAAAADSAPGVPVSVLVTLESKTGNPPPITSDDLKVKESKDLRPIANLRHLDTGHTQMLLLIDDSAGGSFDTEIPEVKKFVNSLPAGVSIGIGYMRNGMAEMTSDFTEDHAKAASTIRLPEGVGGADVSPYDSLTDAIKKWPVKEGVDRREVVMISSGIEGLGGGLPPENPYVNASIASAQKAGVVVYAIYNPSFGHEGHSLWRASWGQNFLSQLTDETGGELYQVGLGSSVSFDSYFADILKRQSEQYVITFEAGAEKKSGLQPIKITSVIKGTSVAAPNQVYVKASL
jgi:hypothetical protein